MRQTFVPFALATALVLAGCATQPANPPTVTNADLSTREISPGDTVQVSFDLEVPDAAAVKRVYVRGLPKNSVLAGTDPELTLPEAPSTQYASAIEVKKPAADGQYNLELVVEMSGKSYVAPLGPLAVRDTPSHIVLAQFDSASHTSGDCLGDTKLLELKYTVEDDNGASDFVAPAVAAVSQDAEKLVFFPHWEPVNWLNGAPGIRLNAPRKDTVARELVTSDIRIFCSAKSDNLYEFVVLGQNVNRLDGKSVTIDSQPVLYYVQ